MQYAFGIDYSCDISSDIHELINAFGFVAVCVGHFSSFGYPKSRQREVKDQK